MNVILDDDQSVGLIAYWDFDRFCYIEYFAISATIRNKGYGSKVLELMRQQSVKPIIMEIELPDTAEAKRRKEFYERNHFVG